MRIRQRPAGGVNSSTKRQVKLVLISKEEKDVANDPASNIPQEYDITMLNTQVKNSYVFSEENLAQFKQEVTEFAQMPEQPELTPTKEELEANSQNSPNTKYYRVHKRDGDDNTAAKDIPFVKTIPKT